MLLTTHYMAEADELCERIAIVDHGRILAIGTPDELKRRVQRESIFRLELDHLDGGSAALARLPGVVSAAVAADTDPESQRVAINLVLEEDGALGAVVGALAGIGSQILALRKSEPTLEDVFVELVGRGFADEDDRRPAPPAARSASPTSRPRSANEALRRHRRDGPADIFARSRGGRPPGPPRTGRAARSPPTTCGRSAAAPTRASGHDPRAVVGVLRDPPAVPRHVGVRLRLSRAPGARGYVGFVVLGGALTAFWLNVIWMMAGQLYWEKSQGNLELYFAAPMNLMAVLLGMAVGGLVMSSTCGRPRSSSSPRSSST